MSKKRKTYILICPTCFLEREISYAQMWNIRVGNSSGRCQKCVTPENGSQYKFVKGQEAWNKGLPPEQQPQWGKTREGMWGEDNPEWKGNNCSHEAHHQWLYRKLGKARECEYCGFEGRCHWANTNNHIYRKDINDYVSLCPKCHKGYDLGRIKL